MSCSTCKHWKKLDRFLDIRGNVPSPQLEVSEDNRAGECRCKPPVSAVSNGGGYRAFPITRGVDGCGEWVLDQVKHEEQIARDFPEEPKRGPGRPKKVS